MNNVDYKLEGDVLVIKINVGKQAVQKAPPSNSGKTFLVASTSGAIAIPAQHCAEMKLSLNVMAKK